MEFAPDGRLFVTAQAGKLRLIKNGALLAAPFLSLSVDSYGERGLLGVAFDPAFSSNGYVYYTTGSSPVHNRVRRFTADPASQDRALARSERVLLEIEAGGAWHNGVPSTLAGTASST